MKDTIGMKPTELNEELTERVVKQCFENGKNNPIINNGKSEVKEKVLNRLNTQINNNNKIIEGISKMDKDVMNGLDLQIKPMDIRISGMNKEIYFNGELCDWLSWETKDDVDGKDGDKITYLINKKDEEFWDGSKVKKGDIHIGRLVCSWKEGWVDGSNRYMYGFKHSSNNPSIQFLGFWIMRCLMDYTDVNNYSNVNWDYPINSQPQYEEEVV